MKYLFLLSAVLISTQVHAAPPRACTNFSGRWAGQCQSGSQTARLDLNISQSGCAFLNVNGHAIAIGGAMSEGHSIPVLGGGTINTWATSYLWWNPNQTALQFYTYLYANDGTPDLLRPQATLYEDQIAGALTIHGGRLVSHSKGNFGEARCDLGRIVD